MGVQNLKHSEATFTLVRSPFVSPRPTHSSPVYPRYFPALDRPSMDSFTSWGMKEGRVWPAVPI